MPLPQLDQTNTVFDRDTCSVRGDGLEVASLNKVAQFTLSVNLSNRNIEIESIVGQLKSISNDGSVTDCSTEPSRYGQYKIQYTPTVCGRHELSLSVNGQQIPGSPFSVMVSVSTELVALVKVWDGINASAITVNSLGDVIVCEEKGISICNRDGRMKAFVKAPEMKYFDFGAITTDKNNNIYCTNLSSNKILQCDKNGRRVQVHEVQYLKGSGYNGVVVVGDNLMVCECNCKGVIVVYDLKLNYERRIEYSNMGQFVDISSDTDQNLYVADATNSCIRVLCKTGVLLHSFGCDKGDKVLALPCHLSVSGQYVYISDYCKHCVSVYTTSGEYISTFGQRGSEEGNFKNPCHVFVDMDHFVWVCDHGNTRIQCFTIL